MAQGRDLLQDAFPALGAGTAHLTGVCAGSFGDDFIRVAVLAVLAGISTKQRKELRCKGVPRALPPVPEAGFRVDVLMIRGRTVHDIRHVFEGDNVVSTVRDPAGAGPDTTVTGFPSTAVIDLQGGNILALHQRPDLALRGDGRADTANLPGSNGDIRTDGQRGSCQVLRGHRSNRGNMLMASVGGISGNQLHIDDIERSHGIRSNKETVITSTRIIRVRNQIYRTPRKYLRT